MRLSGSVNEMEYSGEISVKSSMGDVRDFLSNIENITPCLPGIYDFEIEGNEIKCKLKLDISAAGISAMNTVTGKMTFTYLPGDESLNIQGTGRIAGSKVKFSIEISYASDKEHTVLQWKSSFDFGLIVKIMGKSRVDEISKQNIGRTVKCISDKLN
jgi:carbon monoxide dehydrogenase subunit G